MTSTRRQILRSTLALGGGAGLGLAQWREALAATTVGAGPYGPHNA